MLRTTTAIVPKTNAYVIPKKHVQLFLTLFKLRATSLVSNVKYVSVCMHERKKMGVRNAVENMKPTSEDR